MYEPLTPFEREMAEQTGWHTTRRKRGVWQRLKGKLLFILAGAVCIMLGLFAIIYDGLRGKLPGPEDYENKWNDLE